jgi:hypothetical protein
MTYFWKKFGPMFNRALLFGFFLSLLSVYTLSAQGVKPLETRVGLLYEKERTIGFRAHTQRSLGVGITFGRLRTYYRTTFYHLSLSELRSVKEQRQSPDPSLNRTFRPYAFGKQNNLFVVRGGWGVKRYFSEKARSRGVAIGSSYTFGPSLGLLKPYYLAVRKTDPDNPGNFRVAHQRYNEENKRNFLDNTRVLGASPFTRGLNELGILPGVNASAALHLDWGAFDEFVKAIEIGAALDVFARQAPIMVSDQANSSFFLTFFVHLQLGKRQ